MELSEESDLESDQIYSQTDSSEDWGTHPSFQGMPASLELTQLESEAIAEPMVKSRNNNAKGNDKGKGGVTADKKKNANKSNNNAAKMADQESESDSESDAGDTDTEAILDKRAKEDLEKAVR